MFHASLVNRGWNIIVEKTISEIGLKQQRGSWLSSKHREWKSSLITRHATPQRTLSSDIIYKHFNEQPPAPSSPKAKSPSSPRAFVGSQRENITVAEKRKTRIDYQHELKDLKKMLDQQKAMYDDLREFKKKYPNSLLHGHLITTNQLRRNSYHEDDRYS
jgi:hypothetical protein